MITKTLYSRLTLLLLIACAQLTGQTKADSLLGALKKQSAADTLRAEVLADLAFEYTRINEDSALMFAGQGLSLSEKLNFLNGIIACKNVKGLVFRETGKIDESIQMYEENIEACIKNGKEEKLTSCYANLGGTYTFAGNFPKSILYNEKALALAEKHKQEKAKLYILGNLSTAYQVMGDLDKALNYLNQSLEINKRLKDRSREAGILNNLGILHEEKGSPLLAASYFERSLSIYKELGHLREYTEGCLNLVHCYNDLNRNEEALKLCSEAEQLAVEGGDSLLLADLFVGRANALSQLNRNAEIEPLALNIIAIAQKMRAPKTESTAWLVYADFYKKTGQADKALQAALKGKTLSDSIQDVHQMKNVYRMLYSIYQQKKDFTNAFFYMEKLQNLKDSLNEDDLNSRLANLRSLYELDAKEAEIQMLSKDQQISKALLERKNVMLVFGAAAGTMALVFLFFAIRAYRRKKKDNKILQLQKTEIEQSNAELSKKNIEIDEKRIELEEKNKEIFDSMNYALRIQRSLLLQPAQLTQFFTEYFIFNQPRDIVSGDFYWGTQLRKLKPGKMFQDKGAAEVKGINESAEFILAVGDCTGHGVPGAFMSLLNMGKLSETINEKKINKPGTVLDTVRKEIISVLNSSSGPQEPGKEVNDGMDCTLLRFDRESMTLQYAAANNPFYIVRNGRLNTCPADKMPVGKGPLDQQAFSNYTLNLQPGDMIYLMTDGYADQFGGAKGKKFKYAQLKALFEQMHNLPAEEQEKLLRQTFIDWKQVYEQVDDVLVIGLRV